jgi:hypothetical protein
LAYLGPCSVFENKSRKDSRVWVNFSTGAALKCSSPREAFSRSHPALLLLKLRLLPFDAMTEMNQASYWPFYFQELTSTAATNNHFLCTIQRPVQFLSEGAVGLDHRTFTN